MLGIAWNQRAVGETGARSVRQASAQRPGPALARPCPAAGPRGRNSLYWQALLPINGVSHCNPPDLIKGLLGRRLAPRACARGVLLSDPGKLQWLTPLIRQKALANIANFYREALRRDKAGQELARVAGLGTFRALPARFRQRLFGSRRSRARARCRDYLQEIGLLNADGKEAATACLMLPAMDPHENINGFIAIGKDGQERRFPNQLPYICAYLRGLGPREVTFWTLARESLLITRFRPLPPCR